MATMATKRYGMPGAGPRLATDSPAASSSASKASGGPSSISPVSSSQTGALYSTARLRPIQQHRALSSSTATGEQDSEERGSRASLDTMGGNSVQTILGSNPSDVRRPQRARPVRSFTSPMQFSSSDDDVQRPLHARPAIPRTDSRPGPSRFNTSHGQIQDERPSSGHAYGEHDEAEEEDEEMEPESGEYVVALHDFSSSNATCLSFQAGQVIKVFNRDESGWWDGELYGQRGWFPSNYVDEDGTTASSDSQSAADMGSPRTSLSTLLPSSEAGQSPQSAARTTTSRLHAGHLAPILASPVGSGASHSSHPVSPQGAPSFHSSRSPTPTANTYLSFGRGTSILDPIYHAISLLHNAVRANRMAHFQPSTACVISSVRSVLSATDCLTRESSVLRTHPVLAKERKQILAELSKLVNQARTASAPMVDESEKEWEMSAMLGMADSVLRNVRRFLDVAVECGVTVPDRRSSVYDDLYDERRQLSSRDPTPSVVTDRTEQDKTPTPESPRSSTYRTAYTSEPTSPRGVDGVRNSQPAVASTGRGPHPPMNIRERRQKRGEEPSMPLRLRASSLQSESRESSSCGRSQTGSASGSGSGSGSGSAGLGSGTSHSGSSESLTEDAESSDQSSKISSKEPVQCAPFDVLQRLTQVNDHLLSIIAAFIGHIHGHTRNSHASSYASLIDLTRATVDGVRNLLVIVEAVHESPALRSALPAQISILWETRENVYEATAALVTAARIITSSTTAAANGVGIPPSLAFASEEEEKSKLLQTATAVLRMGGECVGAAKMCMNRAAPDTIITIASAMQPAAASPSVKDEGASTSKPTSTSVMDSSAEEELMDAEEDQAQVDRRLNGVRRGQHTLSLLGRKATSLSCLREQYELSGDRPRAHFGGIDEDTDELHEHQATIRGKERTSEAAQRRAMNPIEAATESDSSEPMSREHSRTSGSTLHSTGSSTTADTSARPSMDRSDIGNLSIDDTPSPPHSAPLHGTFLRTTGRRSNGSSGSLPSLRERSGSLVNAGADAALQQQRLPSSPLSPTSAFASGAESGQRGIVLPADHEEADVCYNSEGHLTGATLQVLVERMTPHDTTIDASFSNTFFLCFRLFTTPMALFDALEARYNIRPPPEIEMSADEFTRWSEVKVAPVRLRVFNFFKIWLENHWHASTDFAVLDRLIKFTRTSMTHSLHRPGQRLADLALKRQMAGRTAKTQVGSLGSASAAAAAAAAVNSRGSGPLTRMMSTDRARLGGGALGAVDVDSMYSPAAFSKGGPAPPTPVVSKSLLASLRNGAHTKISVVDFDPLELARQITIMESKIYCSILPEELLGQEFSKKTGVSNAVHVKTMSALSTHITGWISECILGEEDARKRTGLVKFFIKLGDRCLGLNNFNTLMAIQCALNSSTIARLKRTWDGLPAKHRQMMDAQRQCIEHTRNFAGYRQTLRQTVAPALPFVGLFLTDLTFCHEGNAPTRPSPVDPAKKLLNFDKYVKMSRIIGDLQRFQLPYTLVEVPEIQAHLQATLQDVQQGKGGGSADDLYRRSLLLEPRSKSSHNDSGHHPTPATIAGRGGSDSKLGLDLFNWK